MIHSGWRVLFYSPGLGEALRALGRAFVIGGDWNCTPSEHAKQGWTGKLRGRIVPPSVITCRSGKGRILDYFVASDALAPSILSCSVADNSVLAPRRPVALRMNARLVLADIFVFKGSRKFPQGAPEGPCPAPPD